MGSCVSVHKDPASALKFRLQIVSKDEKVVIPSPVKQTAAAVNVGDRVVADVAPKTQLSPARSTDAGSKDEAFFDSQPWLDSDCEDDFFSVKGDFTPSCGSSPVAHSFSLRNLQVNKSPSTEGATGSVLELSPPDKKKRLSELFKESLRGDQYSDSETAAENKNEAPAKVVAETTSPVYKLKFTNGTRSLSRSNSGGSSAKTPNGIKKAEDRSLKFAQCCLPRLHSGCSFSERSKMMSPVRNHNIG